jgi:hypothetical protein
VKIVVRVVALFLLVAVGARAQMSTKSELPGANGDPTDAAVRHQSHTMGQSLDAFAGHLDDPDPGRRLEAVRLLEQSVDPKANQYLIRAVDNPDVRIAAFAVDALGKRAAKEASETLSEKLFLAGTSSALRQHILAALGRIRDPASARRVLAFAQGESDAELRAAAIRAVGDIGDPSIRDEVRRLGDAETDPRLKTLFEDAVTKISAQGSPGRGVDADSLSKFSHSEGTSGDPSAVPTAVFSAPR